MIERAIAALVARHGPEVLQDVDVLLTHSQLPDLPIVGAGGEVAQRLGITPEWIIDVHNGGCAAFVLMLKLAGRLLAGGAGRTALIAVAQNSAGKIFVQEQVREAGPVVGPRRRRSGRLGHAVGHVAGARRRVPLLRSERRRHDPGRRSAAAVVGGRSGGRPMSASTRARSSRCSPVATVRCPRSCARCATASG